MAYCGYAENLMVIIFIVVVLLLIILIIIGMRFLIGKNIFLVSIKVYNVGFFGDFELLVHVWGVLFLFLVLLIRRRVLIFSFSYIRGLVVRNFIFLYLSFVIRIIWLVLNNNFYWMMFGWDGLGVVSFLLIVFYMNNERMRNGLFTLFQNRIGDLFFVLFMLWLLSIVIRTVLVVIRRLLFLVVGRCVKRAQFPFNSWLLAAMRAPTPISSLVHSSTLVVAGVYILLQYSYCLIDIIEVLKFVSVISLILRRFGLLNELDIKKLIAYPTIRHVSLIIYLLRFKLYKIVYFHLNIHAIFKSLIFICFGFVILSSYHRQDKRLVSLINLNPVIKIVYYFSCICLAGLPFLSAFFSKDLIIEKIIELNGEVIFIVLLLIFLSIRIYYSIKLLMLVNVFYSYIIIDKRIIGMWRVGLIVVRIVIIVNVYLSLVFRLSLEFFSNKVRIYILVIFFFILRLMTNLNLKFISYDKIINIREVWRINFYVLEKYVYWNICLFLQYISLINRVKLFLLINWWVIVLFIIFFYNRSLKSVTLKKLRD